MSLRANVAAAAMLVAWSRPALADAVRLEYSAYADCPAAEAFEARVRDRNPHVRFATGAEAAKTLRVELEARDGTTVGTLAFDDEDARTASGATCTEVVDALALIAALAVPSDPPPEPPAPPEPPEPPAIAVRASPVSPPRDVPIALAPPPLRASVGLGLDGLSFSAPGPRVAPSAFVDLARFGGSTLGFAFRLAFSRATSADLGTDHGTAKLVWTWMRLDACPAQLVPAKHVELRACAAFAGGTASATASNVDVATPRTRAWFAGGALLRAIALHLQPVTVEAQAGALVPFVRQEFYFDADVTAHRMPSALLFAGIAVGVSFP